MMHLVRQVRCADAEHSRTRFGLTKRALARTGGGGFRINPHGLSAASGCGCGRKTMTMNACRKPDKHQSLTRNHGQKASPVRRRAATGQATRGTS
jgi:hypothetical protein